MRRLLPAAWRALLALLLPILAAQARDAGAPSPFWHDVASETQGQTCRIALDSLRDTIRRQPTTSFMAVRGNRVIFREGPVERPILVRSIRKSLLALLYGKAVEEGRIRLDETLAELGIDDIGGLLPMEKQASVLDLLTSRSGVYHPAANPGDDSAGAPARGSQRPGSYFLYNNWDFNVAGDVFEQRAQRNLYDAFNEDIARPLGLEDFERARHRRSGQPSRFQHLSYPFYLSARDLARVGVMMLADGQWPISLPDQGAASNRTVVSPAWIRKITSPFTPSGAMHPPRAARRGVGYGMMWWVPDVEPHSVLSGAYFAWGYFGQWLLVIPKRQMVVVHLYETGAREDGPHPTTLPLHSFLAEAKALAEAPCD